MALHSYATLAYCQEQFEESFTPENTDLVMLL